MPQFQPDFISLHYPPYCSISIDEESVSSTVHVHSEEEINLFLAAGDAESLLLLVSLMSTPELIDQASPMLLLTLSAQLYNLHLSPAFMRQSVFFFYAGWMRYRLLLACLDPDSPESLVLLSQLKQWTLTQARWIEPFSLCDLPSHHRLLQEALTWIEDHPSFDLLFDPTFFFQSPSTPSIMDRIDQEIHGLRQWVQDQKQQYSTPAQRLALTSHLMNNPATQALVDYYFSMMEPSS